MQNQPSFKYVLENAPIILSDDFPIAIDKEDYLLPDIEITGLHVHGCIEIGYCTEGSGIFIVDNKVLPFSEGDAIVLFKNQFHKAQSHAGVTSRWRFIYVEPERLLCKIEIKELEKIMKICNGDPSFDNIISANKYPQVTMLVSILVVEMVKCMDSYQTLIKGLVLTLMIQVGRMFSQQCNSQFAYSRKHLEQVAVALEFISENYMKPIHIKELAGLCHMSLTNFRRIFHKAIGHSPLEYIENVRIQMASILLSCTEDPILEVSQKVGYISLSSFNRNFKKIKGMAPREWRKTKNI